MKPVYIVGAGGAAKEIYHLIKEINISKSTYEFKGFVDFKSGILSIGNEQFSIIEESVFLKDCKDIVDIVFALGDAMALKKISEKYQQNSNFEFPNIIHPLVKIDSSVKLGIGNVIAAASIFTVDITLQSFNYINRGVHVGHDCEIGSYNVINPCAVISGGVIIKDENLIGTTAAVLQYLTIGSKNKVGAGAVITKNVENNVCMTGVPAKNIKNE
jgi:sugar O-acyltransferase (sialic acid O-acetyltransferase NeuD family)